MAAATITLKLDIIPGATLKDSVVYVPGQEPCSDATSLALLARMKSKPATCKVGEILAAIPGTYILSGLNWCSQYSGVRKQWLVFPPYYPGCCTAMPDYYQILRDLAHYEEVEEDRFDPCDIFSTGYCPTPDWENVPAPPPNPYQKEGESPYGFINYSAGNPPPWQVKPPDPNTYYGEH